MKLSESIVSANDDYVYLYPSIFDDDTVYELVKVEQHVSYLHDKNT